MRNLENYPLWTALVTPFNKDLSIDFDSLKKLLKMQEDANAAVLLLGSTGEALALNDNEKREILNFAMSMNLKVPLMAGVGGFNIQKTLEYVKFCETLSLDAYLLVTPIYAKPGKQGQLNWFNTLLDSVTKPCMLYNIPSRAATTLNIEALQQLQNHPNLWSIKESGGSIESFKKYKNALPQTPIFGGDDELASEFAQSGAIGMVSAGANARPKESLEYITNAIQGKTEKLDPNWKNICNELFKVTNPVGLKAHLHKQGIIKTPFLRPPLSHLDA